MSGLPIPLRFVPTLTEVIQAPALPPVPVPPPASPPADVVGSTATPLPFSAAQEDILVQRVLQRIDLVLERRLQEAVGRLVLAHTQSLVPRLRQEIELAVRDCVIQALEQEASPAAEVP